jgi:hypothetical protein
MAAKQNNRWILITFAANFCLTLVTLYMVGIMFWVGLYRYNPMGTSGTNVQQAQCAPLQNSAVLPADASQQTAPQETAIGIEVGDTGFSPKEFTYNNGINSGPAIITIKNTGSKAHSFAVDGSYPNIDSGDIAPGQWKEIHIGNYMFDPDKTYTYYSNSAGDSKDIFSGVMTVTQ